MILLEADIINTTIIDRENLPVWFNLHFQLCCQVQSYHTQYKM